MVKRAIGVMLLGTVLSPYVWLMVSMHTAREQRLALTSAQYVVQDDAEIARRELAFDDVSDGSHLWHVLTFRDPYQLYAWPPLVADAKAGRQPYWAAEQERKHEKLRAEMRRMLESGHTGEGR